MSFDKLIYSREVDLELFLLAQQNDIRAFEELYRRYWPALVKAVYKRLNSKEKAEDLVQNIFIDIYQRRATIDLSNSFRAYLNKAVRFKVMNEYRAELIRARYQRQLFFISTSKNGLASELDAKELAEKFHKVLNGLPEKCKQVFLLSRNENLSNRDISLSLNITVSTVEKHIGRALKVLRKCKV